MDKKIRAFVIIAIIALLVSVVALTVALSVLFELHPKVPAAIVTANINGSPRIGYLNGTAQTQYIIVNGTVTNDSPNIAYNVGLNVTAWGVQRVPDFSVNQNVPYNVINVTVPISSGTYVNGESYPLSTLAAHQSVQIDITIVCSYDPSLTMGSPFTTVFWSNVPKEIL
jgi:hypothetical protein